MPGRNFFTNLSTPANLDEITLGFEKRFEDIGGYWMLEDE
jgi:hypothetical protein